MRSKFVLLLSLSILVLALSGCAVAKEQTLRFNNNTAFAASIEVKVFKETGEEVLSRNATLAPNENRTDPEPLDLPDGKFRIHATSSTGFEAELIVNGNVREVIFVSLEPSELKISSAV